MKAQAVLVLLLAFLSLYLAFGDQIRKPAILGIPVANALFGAAGAALLVAGARAMRKDDRSNL